MPSPKEANTENEFLEFLDQPVQEFEAPDLPEPELDPFTDEPEEELSAPERKKQSSGMAVRYVKLFDKGFSNLAASYSSGKKQEYAIDESDQEDLAEPLSELIAENKILDLPPGWVLIITALIIYAPLAMKAVGERKDHKALIEIESKEKEEKDTDTEQNETDEESS